MTLVPDPGQEILLINGKKKDIMKVVAITSCPSGVAHTYMAAEALKISGEEQGVEVVVETQGGAGIEDPLSPEDIDEAVCAIITDDVELAGLERLRGKKVLRMPVSEIIRQSDGIIRTIRTRFA